MIIQLMQLVLINSFCSKIDTFAYFQLQGICGAVGILFSKLSFTEWKKKPKQEAMHVQQILGNELILVYPL